MDVIDITPELLDTILSTFHTDAERELTRQIVQLFVDGGFPVKVKQYHQACMDGTYRILCFIKKSAESVIINNRRMGRDGVSFQVRIDNRDVLNQLGRLSKNIRDQILNAGDCGNCSPKCTGKKYTFTHQGKEYVKCRFLCNNFTFEHIEKHDIKDLVEIIAGEIAYKRTRAK